MPRGEYDREPRKAQTRAALLAAAARVYARRGFDGATLDEVAAEAGFSKGAVYGHFGSKENLLLALIGEHLAQEISEQIALFDRGRRTWDRPLRGSERWMERLDSDPDTFRLFVELWSVAQRDERVRVALADGQRAVRAMIAGFAAASAQDAGFESTPLVSERFGEIVVALALGLAMTRLLDPDAAPGGLLGGVLSLLIRAVESSPEVRAMLADPSGVLRAGVEASGAQEPAPDAH